MRKPLFLFAGVLIGILAFGGNLLRNPDFSAGNGIGMPLAWTVYRQAQEDDASAARLGAGAFRFVARGRRRVFLQQGGLTLVSGGRYRISADVRTAGNGGVGIRFLVRNKEWSREPATPFLPADTTGRWVRVSSVVVAPPNTAKAGYFFAIEGCGGSAGEASADIRGLTLEACDASVAEASLPLPETDCRVLLARIVPIDPLLSRVDAADGRMRFYWPGDPACGRAVCTLAGWCDGGADVREARFGEDGTAELRFGRLRAGDHRVVLEVRAPDGVTLATNAYAITAGIWRDPAKTGRRLNNLVTELVNAPLADGDVAFVRAEAGWVWISFDGDCGAAEGFLDGFPEPAVRRRTGERRLETQRFVPAGGHVLTVRGAKGGRLRIHAVKSIWGNPIGNLTAKRCRFETGYLRYSLPFAQRFALLSTFNTFPSGSWFFKDDLATLGGFYFERGCQMLNNVHFGPYDARRRDPEASYRILASGMGGNGYPTCVDENIVASDPDSAVCFAEAVWRLFEERPQEAFDVFYADTSSGVTFTDPRKSASEISAVVNSGRGLGLLCPELYLPVLDNARSLGEYVDSCAELMASSERFVPASRGKMVLYTAGYVAIGDWSNYVSPKADVKVHFSNLIRAFATDPRFAGCAGVAFSGLVCCEEEFRRWGTQVIRHYALEGAADDLAARYGYAWAPGLVRDPDFEEGLSAWTVRPAEEGGICAERLPRYGDYFQRRICVGREYKGHLVLPKGFGDTVATFRSSAAGANEVSQRIAGLEPGRRYALLAVVADKKTLTAGTPDAEKLPPFAFSVRMDGATEERGLRFVNSRRGEWKPKGAANKAVMYNLRYVFRADASEATLVFSDRGDDGSALEPGTELSLNYVVLRPYYSEGPEEIPEIVSALRMAGD